MNLIKQLIEMFFSDENESDHLYDESDSQTLNFIVDEFKGLPCRGDVTDIGSHCIGCDYEGEHT